MRYEFMDWVSIYLAKIPNFLLALLVLLLGWIIAKSIGKAVEKFLKKTKWDEKFLRRKHVSENQPESQRGKKQVNTNEIIGKVVYYILLVFVFMIFFHLLNLGGVASPFMAMIGSILDFIPAILKAALILLLAYVIASVVRIAVEKVGQNPRVTESMEKINVAENEAEVKKYTQTAGNIVFYLIMLLFIPGVLSALNIGGVAEPFGWMIQSMLAFIPKVLAAALILFIGWIVARIIRDLVTGLLKSVGTEKLAGRIGLSKVFGDKSVSSVIGTIVFVLIMIPIVISALDQLQLQAVTAPAIAMLNDIMLMIPNIIIAVLLILVGVWIGKWVRQIVSSLLQRVGFDSLTRNMVIGNWKPGAGSMALSELVGYIAQVLVVFFLTIEALQLIKLGFLVAMLTAITAYLPMVLAAVIILGLGLIVANIVSNVLSNILSGPSFRVLASVAKYSIIALSIFMALDQLGIADTIVNSAFILILGGLALAFGLSFGLGGKDFASNYLAKLDRTIDQTDIDTSKAPRNPAEGQASTGQSSDHGKKTNKEWNEKDAKEYRKKGGPEDFLPPNK